MASMLSLNRGVLLGAYLTPNGFPSLFFNENGLNHVPFMPGSLFVVPSSAYVIGRPNGCSIYFFPTKLNLQRRNTIII